jgi:hypothetical protein
VPGLADPLPGDEVKDKPKDWANRFAIQQRHIEALRHLLTVDLPEPPPMQGDGVLIVGGGKYWLMAVLSVRMLRSTGCTLPVQVWYRGAEEPVNPADVEGLDVRLVDSHAHAQSLPPEQRPRILRGWENKTYAMLHCGWRRIFYLDADAYCLADPTLLFDLSDDRIVYWVDLPDTANHVRWSAFGMEVPQGNRVPMIQGGQVLIDMHLFWREFVLAHWLNQHSDYSYQHGYGDQDQWRVALALTQGSYRVLGFAQWQHPAFTYVWEGVCWLVHRCRGKFFPGQKLPDRNDALPREAEVFALWEKVQHVSPGVGPDVR